MSTFVFFFNDTATTEIYTLSLHDALPVFGLLGPNGAGKTSTIEILEGLRNADGGTAAVCGLDPAKDSDTLKHEIGAALQSTALPEKIRVMEALRLFASFYTRRRNPEEL